MRKQYLITLFWFLLHAQVFASGIDFFHGTFDEAKMEAREEGKLIFVDAYTTWCGPCKRMSAQVFTNDKVGEYFNRTFVNLKLDMEKGEGRTFQQKYRVAAFPTLLFLDPEGAVVHRVVGGMDVTNFLKLGQFASGKVDVSSDFDRAYKEGQRDPEFMAEYIEALAKSHKPILKVANEYLSTQKDLTTEPNLRVIYHATVEADSRIFNMLVENRKKIIKLFGKAEVESKVQKAANATVKKAIEFDNADLLEEAVDKVNRYAPSLADVFEGKSRLTFYSKTGRMDEYLREAKSYVRKSVVNKFEVTNYIIYNQRKNDPLMKAGNEWSKELVKNEASEPHFFIAAQYQYFFGHYKMAKEFAEKALELSKENKTVTMPHIKSLIEAIDNKLDMK